LPAYTVLGYQENGAFVNKNTTKYIRNTHFVAGVEYNTKTDTKISIEGYYKSYDNYPFLLGGVGQPDSISLANLGGDFGVIGNQRSVPTNDGKSYGVEFLVQQRLFKGFYGILAYTIGASEFKDRKNQYVASSWDARHIVALTAGKQFGKNWEIGVKWRFQTGLPYTPADPNSALVSVWNNSGRALLDYRLLNTERTNATSRIDLRIDKKWFYKKSTLNIFFDIQNLTADAAKQKTLVLDRPLGKDANGKEIVIGEAIIENPNAPADQQRYKTKFIDDIQGNLTPNIGLQFDF
jgi:hypothetical protein